MEVPESRYKKSKFHEVIAAQMMGREGTHIFGRMNTGEGKSFVMIMLANAHAKLEENVVLVVTDEMLYE